MRRNLYMDEGEAQLPETARPFVPVRHQPASPIRQVQNSAEVREQRDSTANDAHPGEHLISQHLQHSWLRSRLRQLRDDGCAEELTVGNVLCVHLPKRQGNVSVGDISFLHRNKLAVCLGSASLCTHAIRI